MVWALVMLVGGTGSLTDCASVLLSLKFPSGCHIHQRTGASPSRGPPGPPCGPGKPLVTFCRSAAIDDSQFVRVPSTLEVRLWDTINTTATAIKTYKAATIPAVARATRWAPERTRSTRGMLNVLSPGPMLPPNSFRIHDGPHPNASNARTALKRGS